MIPLSLFRNAELESLNNEIAQLKLKLAPCKSSTGCMYTSTYMLHLYCIEDTCAEFSSSFVTVCHMFCACFSAATISPVHKPMTEQDM